MKLRILSIGLELEHDEIMNADFRKAPTFHDFDVVLIDPDAVVNFFHTKKELVGIEDGWRIIKWDSVGTGRAITTMVKKRKQEAQHFLRCGRLLICMLRGFDAAYVYSHLYDAPSPLKEDHWVNNYGWFPLLYSDSMISMLLPSSGDKVTVTDPMSPFAPYFNAFAGHLHYEACLDENGKPYYFEDFHTFSESYGGLPVGFSFGLEGGQVVFLPPLDKPDPEKLAGVLLDCIHANQGTIEETKPPPWVSHYKAFLPGLSDLESKAEGLKAKLSELTTRLNSIEQQKAEKEKYLKLLYEQGKLQLEPVVRDAFSLLGFIVTDAEPSDGLLESDDGVALLEAEGKDDNAIKIDKYQQLLDYVVDDEKETQQLKKGILVGNGFRLKDPEEREQQFTKGAIDAATGGHFCLLTTKTLFDLVCQVLENPDNDESKSQIRKQLLTTDGLFHLESETND